MRVWRKTMGWGHVAAMGVAMGLALAVWGPPGAQADTSADPQPAAQGQAVFHEPFEADALSQWKLHRWDTAATLTVVNQGQWSDSSLEVDKPDIAGLALLTRQVPVQAGHHYRLTMDIQTLRVRPQATYFIRLGYYDAQGQRVGGYVTLPYDDGLAFASHFGGNNKLPQTMGQWRQTQHLIQAPPSAVSVEIGLAFGAGQQRARVDNLRLADLGTDAPPAPADPPVFERQIRSAGVAGFTLDMLVPGWTYEIHATADSDRFDGMGIAMAWVDVHGRVSQMQELPRARQAGRSVWYRLVVPQQAVEVQLDLHNDDYLTLGHGDINQGDGRKVRVPAYRNWRSISVRTQSRSMIVDTQYHNYVYRVGEDLELIRPRNLVEVTEYDRQVIDAHVSRREPADAKVELHQGGMALRVGDTLLPPIIHTQIHARAYDYFTELGRHGGSPILRIQNIVGGPALNGQWVGPNQYDFAGVDEVVYRALKQNPDAHLILDIGALYPPAWWGDQHPDQIIRDQDGKLMMTQDSYFYRVIWGDWENGAFGRQAERQYHYPMIRVQGAKRSTTYVPSTVSRPYRRDMAEFITALRRHVESRPYGPAVIGYVLAWGYDMQWGLPTMGDHRVMGQPGKSDPAGHAVDYSQPMVEHFRQYLRHRYGSDGALKEAWGDPNVTLATAGIPTPEQRRMPYKGPYLLDPAARRAVIDYETALRHSVGDLLDAMGNAVKAAGSRQVVTLAYFQDEYRDLGHEQVITGGGLDIAGGPSYQARELGQSGVTPLVMDSYRLHGKLAMTEVDHRGFVTSYRRYKGNQVFETPRKTISMLQREFARHMCDGGGAWTFDMGYGWFTHPIMVQTLAHIRQVFEQVMAHDRSSIAQVGVFLGDYALNITSHPNIGRSRDLRQGPRISLSQSGLPYAVYRLSDLPAVASRHRVFIFPHAWALTDAERRQIDAIKRDGNLLVFGPAAGFASERRLSDTQVSDLVGMAMQRDDSLAMMVQVRQADHPLTQGVGGTFIGDRLSQEVGFPVFHVTDPKAQALGDYVGSQGKVGFAYKDHGSWQSVYLGVVSYWPPELFQAIGRAKGLHVYGADGDVMFFARSLVAVHASTDGVKTLTLPGPMRVRSLWDDKDLGVTGQIRRPMRVGDNALYLLEPVE